MRIEVVALQDFRNYGAAELELSQGLNLVVGANAQGKTNLLESVYCLGGLGSPRSHDAALIREGADRALLHGVVTRGRRKLEIDLEIGRGRPSRALVNKSAVSGIRTLAEYFTSVFFGPDELSLIKGSPGGRRRFLDDLFVKLRPSRDGIRRDWERVLRQRNALLKSMPRGDAAARASETLEVWDASFVRAGAALAAERVAALGRLVPFAQRRYSEVAGGGRLALSYESGWLDPATAAGLLEEPETVSAGALEAVLEGALEKVRVKELERGLTLVGPQRDDVLVTLARESGSPLDARVYASQGDQRTSALALKLGEFDLVRDALGEEPVLLLDDVYSELDPARRRWLSTAVSGIDQAIVSSAEPGAVEAAGATRVIEVSGGTVHVA